MLPLSLERGQGYSDIFDFTLEKEIFLLSPSVQASRDGIVGKALGALGIGVIKHFDGDIGTSVLFNMIVDFFGDTLPLLPGVRCQGDYILAGVT